MAKTLIACTDLSSNSLPALKQAAWLAATLNYSVRLVFVVDPAAVLSAQKRNVSEQREQLRQWANAQVKLLQEKIFPGMAAEASIIELHEHGLWSELTKPYDNHAVAQAICQAAAETQAAAVVLGTHGDAGLSDVVLGTVAMRVVRLAPCDVLTVRPNESEQSDAPLDLAALPIQPIAKGIRSILCAVDFSEGSRLAVERALQLAQPCGATVHLMHTYRVPFWMGPGSEEVETQLADQVKHSIEQLSQQYSDRGVALKCHVASGRPPMKIRELAMELDVDWIVMGVLGQTGLEELLVGSVTERLVRMAPRPVLAVRKS